LAVLLSAFLIILYLPDFLTAVFGLPQIWDLYTPISNLVGENLMGYFDIWGATGIMVLFFLIYFVSLAARPSKSATMFRLTGILGAMCCSLPFMAISLSDIVSFDISNYVGYGILGLTVLALIFYIIGQVLRVKQKFHKNRASTTLVFCVTFWLVLSLIFAVYYAGLTFKITALTDAMGTVNSFVITYITTILAIYLLVSAIWMFLTVPHHVRVQYNADTPDLKKPTILPEAKDVKLTPEEEKMANQRSSEAIRNSGAPVTQPLNVYPDRKNGNQSSELPNPYRRNPIQPIPTSPIQMHNNLSPRAQNLPPIRQVAPQNNIAPVYQNPQNNQVITPNNPYNPNTIPNSANQFTHNAQPQRVATPQPNFANQLPPRQTTNPQNNSSFANPTNMPNAYPNQYAQPQKGTQYNYPPAPQPARPQVIQPPRPQVIQPSITQQNSNSPKIFNPNNVQPARFNGLATQNQPVRPNTYPSAQPQRPYGSPTPRPDTPYNQPARPNNYQYGQNNINNYPRQPNAVNNPNNFIPNNLAQNNTNTNQNINTNKSGNNNPNNNDTNGTNNY